MNSLKSGTVPFLNSIVPERKAKSRVFLSMVSEYEETKEYDAMTVSKSTINLSILKADLLK